MKHNRYPSTASSGIPVLVIVINSMTVQQGNLAHVFCWRYLSMESRFVSRQGKGARVQMG